LTIQRKNISYTMRLTVHNWQKIDDVPVFFRTWAEYIAERKLSVEEIKDLVESYESYINSQDDIELHDSTISQ